MNLKFKRGACVFPFVNLTKKILRDSNPGLRALESNALLASLRSVNQYINQVSYNNGAYVFELLFLEIGLWENIEEG